MEVNLNVRSEYTEPSCLDCKDASKDIAIVIVSVALSTLAALGIAFALTSSLGLAALVGVAVGLTVAIGCIAYRILKTDENVIPVIPEVTHTPPTTLSTELAEVVDRTPQFNDYKFQITPENPSYKKGLENLELLGMSIRPANLFFKGALDRLNDGYVTTMPGSGELFAFALDHDEIVSFIKRESETDSVVTFSAPNDVGRAAVPVGKEIYPTDVVLDHIYGNKEYSISYKEIQDVLDSQKIYVSSLMPIDFYLGLKDAMAKDGIIELRKIREGSKVVQERSESLLEWADKSVVAFLKQVQAAPQDYGFEDSEAFNELMNLTIYQIGSMVVCSEDWHIFVDGNLKILEREAETTPPVRLINACGIRPEKKQTNSVTNKKIMTETFKTALAAAENGIVIFPAVGMGVWGGRPALYWEAFLDAVVASSISFEAIFVNPNHRPYNGDKNFGGQEFETYLQTYITTYSNGPSASQEIVEKLKSIHNLQKKKTDLVQLARELKLQFPEKTVSIFNASDPDVTLGNHVGEYVNNMPHTMTTEENYTAIGTNGLCFKSITKVHENPDRLFQVDFDCNVHKINKVVAENEVHQENSTSESSSLNFDDSSSSVNHALESVQDVEKVEDCENNEISIKARCLNGKELVFHISIEDDVAKLKTLISQRTGIPVDKLRLIFAGKDLKEGKCSDYNIQKGSVMHYISLLR